MKPYYDQDGITIYHGDCKEVLPTLDRADLILTDPPYNAGKDYGPMVDDKKSRDDYAKWCSEIYTPMRAAAKRIILFPGHGNMDIWMAIKRPSAVGCWYKPGNSGSSVAGFVEWEPWLFWAGDRAMLRGSDTLRFPVTCQSFVGDHPCPKPLGLFRKLIWKDTGSTIIDPLMGSGTTLVAAALDEKSAIGIEIEEKYCEIAARRLSQKVLQL